jgi:tetratricopeptide (TPR) repeat protein
LESWLAWAEGLETLGRLQDAIDVLDRATASDAAGDHAAIRTMKARILLRMNLGSRAKDVLTTNLDNIPKSERPDLSKALGDLLQELGNRAGAREAYLEWSRLSPESPFPALKLLSIAQVDGDEEASKAGLEALTRLGRDNEPYALAARALQYLRTDPSKPGPPPADRIAKAQDLVRDLDRKAPDFPVKFMIQGMIYEAQADPKNPQQWRDYLTKAGENYRKSIKPGTPSPALPKLIEVYMRLKDTDKLNLLKLEYDDGTQRHKTETAMEFDRLSTIIALKLGDRKGAKMKLTDMVVNDPTNREIRFAQVKMLEADGNFLEAETQLKDLVKIRPEDRMTWIELIRFNKNHRSAADVAKAIEQARQNYTGDRPELFLAECYWNGNDIPNATSQFQKAVDAMPDDLLTLQTLILFRDSTNQRDQIDSVFRKILKLDPKNTWASRGLAMRLTNRADPVSWAEAWSLVAPGAPGTSDKAEDRLIRATVMARSLEIARRAESFQAFESLANDLPISNAIGIEARLRLSQALLEIDRPAEAWQHISPICDDLTRPNSLALAIGIEALARQGKAEEADYRLSRLALQIPNSGQLAISRAWVLSAQDKKKEAADLILATYDRAEKEPEGEAVGENLLNLLLKFHNLDAAKTLAQKMTARWPAQVRNLARVQLARAEYDDVLVSCKSALEQGTPREAITYAAEAGIARRLDPAFLKKVEDLGILARGKSPRDHFILICLATVYHLQAKYDQEIAFYRMALELNPEKQQFLNNMAWTLSEGLSQPEEGLKWIEELLKREGPTPQYLDTRGVIQTRLKNYDQAIADLEKSAQLDPAPMTYFHLARAYQKAGKLNESRRYSAKFREAKIDLDTLDPTDRSDLIEVMGSP